MRTIGVVASPRRGQNTGTLVQKVLEGVESAEIDTELHYISDYQIGPCRACDACKETGECVQDDDMHVFHAAIERARGLVLGTPIYLDHVSAQCKIFLDRLYCYLGPDGEHRFPKGVKAVLVVTWEASNPKAYDSVIDWLRGRLSHYFEIDTLEVIKAANTANVPVHHDAELLGRAFEAGVTLAAALA